MSFKRCLAYTIMMTMALLIVSLIVVAIYLMTWPVLAASVFAFCFIWAVAVLKETP